MRELSIRSVRLPSGTPFENVHALAEEFPTVSFERRGALVRGDAMIDLGAWSVADSFRAFDDAVEGSITGRLVLEGDPNVTTAANEVITRYQRWLDRRTAASKSRVFNDVLVAHRQLHDEREQRDHAVDTWQWVLRLAPDASLPLQLAALFREVEGGGDTAHDVLVRAGIERNIAARTRDLIAGPADRLVDRESGVLADADGLSFFSLESAAYLDRFGPLSTRRKIGHTLARLGRHARYQMSMIRLRPDVGALFSAIVRA